MALRSNRPHAALPSGKDKICAQRPAGQPTSRRRPRVHNWGRPEAFAQAAGPVIPFDAQGDWPQDRRDLRVRAHGRAHQDGGAGLPGLRSRVLPLDLRHGDAGGLARLARRIAGRPAHNAAARPYRAFACRLLRNVRQLCRPCAAAARRRDRLHLRHAAHGRAARLDRARRGSPPRARSRSRGRLRRGSGDAVGRLGEGAGPPSRAGAIVALFEPARRRWR